MLDLRRKRDVMKMTAEQLEAWIDETEECGDGFSSEVNTKEVDDTDKQRDQNDG